MDCYCFLRVARHVRTDASTAGMGLRLLTVYYGLGYMLPTMSQFQVGISYCLVFFASIPLVHYLDTTLIHCISKAMDSLRFKHLGAADLPDSILYCIQSLLMFQCMLGMSFSLLKLMVDNWLSSSFILWQASALEDLLEIAKAKASISAGAFSAVLAKNMLATML